jgi:Protein of unknown function (DUF3168)
VAELEQAFIGRINADPEANAYLNGRVYFHMAPQAPALPYAVLFRVDTQQIHSLSSSNKLKRGRVQLDIYANNQTSARKIATTVRDALDGFRGTQSTINVQGVLLLDEFDGYDEEPELRRVTQDYGAWYLQD